MKKVMITGAGGFIGRHAVVELIHRGYEVHAVTSQNPPRQMKDCTWHKVDLLDTAQTRNLLNQLHPSHLLHFAWYTVPGDCWTSPQNDLWLQASLEMMREFQEQGGERVVMAGSCAEYGWSDGDCSEEITPLRPNSHYGLCKKSLQETLESYSQTNGLSSAWGRIFHTYGPYENPNRLVPSVICSLLQGKPALCSHGHQIRDFLYVTDLANGFVELLTSKIKGPVNIASGQPVTIENLVGKIAEKLSRPDLIQLGARPLPKEEPPRLVAHVSRLLNELNWRPRYSLETGLDQTIEWWKKQLS